MTPTPEQIEEAARKFVCKAEIKNPDEQALHPYTDTSGNPIYWRLRLKNTVTGEKWIRPFYFDGERFQLGEPDAPGVGKPLYALDLLAAHPDALVWAVEGEKAADALNKAFKEWNLSPQHVATTSGGASSAVSANWTVLAGRPVFIWMDNDNSGRKYALDVMAALLNSAASVGILDIASLNLPKGGDAYDWLQREDAVPAALTLLLERRDADQELQAAICHLLPLPLLAYERTYKDIAKQLGMRATLLDQEVKAARSRQIEEKDDAPMFPDVEPWGSPVDAAEVLSALADAFRRYAVLPPHCAEALALWCAFTWFCKASHIAPLLVLRSPEKGCGKTTVLSIVKRLVYRPLPLSGITAAVLFRVADRHHPTVLIDEGDTFLNSKNQEMHGIINCGHSRDAPYVWRCVGDDHEPQCFDVFGPKAIAFIGRTRDTLHDRAVEVELARKLLHEKVSRLRNGDGGELEDLARKLARLSLDYLDDFAQMKPDMPESLPDRQADNWEPMFAIAMLAGDEWVKKATEAAVALTTSKVQSAPISARVKLLRDSYEIIKEKATGKIQVKDLVKELCEMPDGDWSAYNKGAPITQGEVAKLLRDFGILNGSVRERRLKPYRGYRIEQFKDPVSRYCDSLPENAEEYVTTLQTSIHAGAKVTDAEIVTVTQTPFVTSKPNTGGGCNDVTEIPDGTSTSETPTRRVSLRI